MTEFGLTYFDIGALIVIVVFLLLGFKRGFLKEIGRIICWLISLIGSKILVVPIEGKVYEVLKVKEKLSESITTIIESLDFSSLDSLRSTLNTQITDMPIVGPFLNSFADKEWAITDMYQNSISTIQTDLHNFILESVEPIAHQVVSIGVFVLLFIVLVLFSSLLYGLLEKLFTSIKLVGTANALLGGVIGLVKGVLFVLIVYSLLFIGFTVTKSENINILKESKFYDTLIGVQDIVTETNK